MNAQEQGRFLFLDGLRGIAAIAVVLFHCYSLLALHVAHPFPTWTDTLFFVGHYGVQIFFVLSGFVIAYSTRNALFNARYLRDFFIRRSLRLDPPYWVVVMGLLLLSYAGTLLFHKESNLSMAEIVANLCYVQGFFHMPSILPVAWTLCIELQLYLVVVAVLTLIATVTKSPTPFASPYFYLLFGLLTLFCLSCHAGLWNPFAAIPSNALFVNFWHHFFAGALVCWVLFTGISSHFLSAFALLTAASLAIAFNGEDAAALLTAAVIFAVAKGGKLSSLMTGPIVQWSGRISYSLYLTHWMTGLKFIDTAIGRVLGEGISWIEAAVLFTASLAIIFFAAHLFYVWIEKPSLQLSRRWHSLFESRVKSF